MPSSSAPWWHAAVVYQVHLRGYADADGDGVGDLPGLLHRLDHIADLGADALWIGPWYPSPLADNGYDVADYRSIDPRYGTLEDARAVVEGAHARGLRVILDVVANHVSGQHPWFTAALAAGPGSPERERFHFRDAPTDWSSAFGGPAWTQVPDGQWYLHVFAPEQPDVNWEHPEVRREFADIVDFWLAFGIDGLRVDAAPAFAKDPTYPLFDSDPFASTEWTDCPFWDRDAVHELWPLWRAVADRYDDRLLIAEAIVRSPERLAAYVAPGRLHQAWTFDFLKAPWDADALRAAIDGTLGALEHPCWVLSNHDETRVVTRYGRADTAAVPPGSPGTGPSDLELGRRRARAAALLMLALPGGAYVYQGEELGLEDVEDLPEDALEDPMWERSGHAVRGRDGCRVPLPWAGDAPPFEFGGTPRLSQPPGWAARSVAAQAGDPDSVLSLYRAALALRREWGGGLAWRDAPAGVLDFDRGAWRCVVNLSDGAVPLDGEVRLASGPLSDGALPPDTAVWIGPPPR